MASPADSNVFDVPEIMPFQFDGAGNGSLQKSVNLFRGDVNFYFTLVSLPGRNGLDVKVSALYRSNVTVAANQWNLQSPTSVLGLGWQLPFDRIVADQKGAGSDAGRQFHFVHGDSWSPLHRVARRWPRGTLDPSCATLLDTGTMSPSLAAAFLAEGLIVAPQTHVAVVEAGRRWRLADPINEYTLDVDKGTTRLDVFDGGQAYELESFDFSRIRFYPEYERWEVTRTDGVTHVFGGGVSTQSDGTHTSAGNVVEWAVRWNNFLGPSALTHAPDNTRAQTQYATSWNFSSSYSVWGDRIRFEYDQVQQRVGANGLPYTKACYLHRIVDAFGRTVIFNYAAKTFDPRTAGDREYLDPHKPVPNDDPDAYQSQYETRYLSSIDVFNEDGLPLNTVTLAYDVRHYAVISPHDPPSMQGDTAKRVLTSITRTLPNGAAMPNVQLSYYGGADPHPGAIASVVYPEGGTVRYLYQQKELSDCSRSLSIDRPMPDAQPRVWFGPDYALVAWYDGQGKLQLRLYTWVGRWQVWQPPQTVINAFVNLDDMTAVVQDDFVVLHYATSTGQTTECWVFHKDNLVLGGWIVYPGNPIVLRTTKREVAGGSGFFAINDRLEHIVTRYAWDGLARAWRTSTLDNACDPGVARKRFFITAYNNVLLSLCYDIDGPPEQKKNRLRLDYRDEMGAWQTGDTVAAPEISIAGPDIDTRFTWTPQSWVMAATFVTTDQQVSFNYRVALYQWLGGGAAAYKLRPVTTRDYTQKNTANSTQAPYNYIAQVTNTGLVASGGHLLRYNGAAWLDNDHLQPELPFTQDDVFWFAYGDDVAVKTENSPARIIGQVLAYDANTEVFAWKSAALPVYDSAPQLPRLSHYFPTAGPDLLTWNLALYGRGSSNNWVEPLRQPIFEMAPTVDTSTIVNQSPGFLAHLVEDASGKQVLGTQLIVLRNGQVFANEFVPERFFRVVKQDGTYESFIDGKLPGGPSAFFTYQPVDQDLEHAQSITLYRVVADSIKTPIKDFPAYAVVQEDGLSTTEFSFRFDERRAACDVSGTVAKYFNTIVAPGNTPGSSDDGWTEYEFINSLANLPPGTNPNVPAPLDGQLAQRRMRDRSGALVASTTSIWEMRTTIAAVPGGPGDVPIYGAYLQTTRVDQIQDGVTTTIRYSYDAASGQQVLQETDNDNASGQHETRRVRGRFAYQTYPAFWYINDLVETVLSRKSVQVDGGSELITEVKAVTWQPYPRPLDGGSAPGGATVPVWATYKSYTWRGGSGSSDFDFAAWSGSQEPPAAWFKASQIDGRASHGAITEKQAPMGMVTSTLFDRLEGMSVAAFSRASLSNGEAYFYGFESYEKPPVAWPLDPKATPIVDGIANTGRHCLKLPPNTKAATLELQVKAASTQYLVSFWGYTGANYDPSRPAGCTIQVGGSAAIDVMFGATPGWKYYAHVVSLAISTTAVPVRVMPFNRGAVDAYLDDVAFAAYQGQVSATVFEGPSLRVAAELGPYERLVRRMYDPWQRQIARTDEADSLIRLAVPFLARQAAPVVSASLLNCEIDAQPMGAAVYDRFYNLGDWTNHWQSSTPDQWSSADGRLAHAAGPAGEITLTHPSLTTTYFFSTFVAQLEPLTQPLGLRIGTGVTISWQPATGRWQLNDTINGVTLDAPFTGSNPGRGWFVAITERAIAFTSDGRLAFSYLPVTMPSGACSLFAGNRVAFSEVMAGGQPQLGAQFADGAAKFRQGHSVEGANATITANVYDALARPAIQTKPASFAADQAHPLLVYRPSFVEHIDWRSGVMTGDVANAYPEDEGYPYARQRFEASPLARVIEAGRPGKTFAIVDLDTTAPADRHTTKTTYGSNQANGFPAPLNLPARKYYLQTSIDPDGNISSGVSDKAGSQIASGMLIDPGTQRYVITSYLTTFTTDTRVEIMRLPNYYEPPDPSTQTNWQRVTAYDFIGRKLSFIEPDGGVTRFIYDPVGALRFSQDASCEAAGTIVYQKSDPSLRPIEEGLIVHPWDVAFLQEKADRSPDWPTIADGAKPQRVYTYDGDGTQVTSMGMLTRAEIAGDTAPGATVSLSYEYDEHTRMRTQTVSAPGVSQTPAVTHYDYDNLGNLTSTVYPSGSTVTHRYDEVGRIHSLIDGGGQMIASYLYGAGDQLLSETLYAGGASQVTTTYDYNPPGWVEKIDSPFLSESIEYTSGGYNGAGFYSGKVASVGVRLAVPNPGTFPAEMTFRTAYDATGRLTAAECSSNGTVLPQYSLGLANPVRYDDNGNFLTVDTGAGQERYVYTPGTDIVLNTNGGAAADYRTDASGSIIAAQPRGITDIRYNLLSRLPASIATTSRGTVGLDYDHQGRRVVKQSSSASRLYVRNGSGFPIWEQDFVGAQAADALEYVYGPTGLIALRSNSETRLVLRDHLKSTRALLAPGGSLASLASAIQYEPFGSLVAPVYGDSALLRYYFTGYEIDSETGLYNAIARLYDPYLRRFYGVDPKLQFASPYLYGGNNPLMMVDPSGQASWWAILIGAIVGTVATLLTGVAGVAIFGTGLAAATAVGAVAGAVGALAGDVVTAAIDREPITASRMLTDVVTGGVGGAAGAFVGGALGQIAMRAAFAYGLRPGLVSLVGGLVGGISGGVSGAVASAATASAITGQSFFSSGNALSIAMGALGGAGGALMAAGVHFGIFGTTLPFELGNTPADFALIAQDNVTAGLASVGDPAYLHAAQTLQIMEGGTERFLGFVPRGQFLRTGNEMLANHIDPFVLNGQRVDVVAVHGMGRYVFPLTTAGYMRPMKASVFAQFLQNRYPGYAGRVQPIKMYVCFSALTKPWGTGRPGISFGSSGQVMATALNRETYGGRWVVYPSEVAQNWIHFTP